MPLLPTLFFRTTNRKRYPLQILQCIPTCKDFTTFRPPVTFTTPLELIACNDHRPPPPGRITLLSLTLRPGSNRLNLPPTSPGPSAPLDIFTSLSAVPTLRAPTPAFTSLSCPPPSPSQLPNTAAASPGSPLSYASRRRHTPRPFHPDLALRILTPPRGGGWQGLLAAALRLRRPRVPLTRPRLGLSARLPSTAPLPEPCLRRTVGQHEPRTRHLLGKVGGGEGAPLV